MLTSANTWRTGESVLEAPGREPVIHFQDLRLVRRLLAPQSEETNLVVVEIHLTAHQAAGPDLAERPGPSQQAHLTQAIAAPQINQPTARPLLQFQLPGRGEGPSRRRGFQPRRAVRP